MKILDEAVLNANVFEPGDEENGVDTACFCISLCFVECALCVGVVVAI